MNFEKFLGQPVTVVLREGSYHGIISRLDSVSRRITLRDVQDPDTGKKYPGLRHFYVVEILDLKFDIDDEYTEEDIIHNDISDVYSEENEHSDIETDENSEEDQSNDQDKYAKSCDRFTIVKRKDLKASLAYIRKKRSIGLSIESLGEGRFGTINWISISVQSHVYIFDFKAFGRKIFSYGLKSILEDSTITKFIHDCRFISDLLHHKYDVQLANVFDTQVADAFVHRLWHGNGQKDIWPKYVQNLAACLYGHLELSTEQIAGIRIGPNRTKQEEDMWIQRPLKSSLAECLYISVVYIEELGSLLLNKMMVDYLACVDIYLGSARDQNDSDALWTMRRKEFLPRSFSDVHKFTHPIKESFRNIEKKSNEFCFTQCKSCSCDSQIPDLKTSLTSKKSINFDDDLQCPKEAQVPSSCHKSSKKNKESSVPTKLSNCNNYPMSKNISNNVKQSSKHFSSSIDKEDYQKDYRIVKDNSSSTKIHRNLPTQESSSSSNWCDLSKHKKDKNHVQHSNLGKTYTDHSCSREMLQDEKTNKPQSDCFKDKISPSHHGNRTKTPGFMSSSSCNMKRTAQSRVVTTHENSTANCDKPLYNCARSKQNSTKDVDTTINSKYSSDPDEDPLIDAARQIFPDNFTPGLRKLLEESSGPNTGLVGWKTEKESNTSTVRNRDSEFNQQKTETVESNVVDENDSRDIDWSLYKSHSQSYSNINFYPAGYSMGSQKKKSNSKTNHKKYKQHSSKQ
ncbi:uncharacterized protein LOC115213833 [Argonauta hians]